MRILTVEPVSPNAHSHSSQVLSRFTCRADCLRKEKQKKKTKTKLYDMSSHPFFFLSVFSPFPGSPFHWCSPYSKYFSILTSNLKA